MQLEAFVTSLVGLVLCPEPHEPYPETFNLDRDRLDCLRADLHDLIYLDICSETFEGLMCQIEHMRHVCYIDHHALRHDLLSIVGDSGTGNRERIWTVNVQNISVEIARHILRSCGYVNAYDAMLLCKTEDLLRQAFYQSSVGQGTCRNRVAEDLLARVLNDTRTCMTASPVDMFNALVAPVGPPPLATGVSATPAKTPIAQQHPVSSRTSMPAAPDHLSDISQRLTHIAVLHWRVWNPIIRASQDTAPAAADADADAATRSSSPPGLAGSPSETDGRQTPESSGAATPSTSGARTPASEAGLELELGAQSAAAGPPVEAEGERAEADAGQELEVSGLALRQREQ